MLCVYVCLYFCVLKCFFVFVCLCVLVCFSVLVFVCFGDFVGIGVRGPTPPLESFRANLSHTDTL